MVTTKEAAKVVRLNKEWQEKYRRRATQFMAGINSSQSQAFNPFTICIVGRCGVGKGSLINHLLRHPAAVVSQSSSPQPGSMMGQESSFNIYGFRVREIPAYDSRHPSAKAKKHHHNWRHIHGKKNSEEGCRLDLEDFVKGYRIFDDETKAIIFVVNNRITEEDRKLMAMAVESRKFLCVVRTHADNFAHFTQPTQIETLELDIRKELRITKSLNVRIFIVAIPWPNNNNNNHSLSIENLQQIDYNTRCLCFPFLQAYLAQPMGLHDELQIHSFVKEEVWEVLTPVKTVKKRHQLLDFSEHAVAGTLLPIAGPVMVSFVKTLVHAIKACSHVGLIEESEGEGAVMKLSEETGKRAKMGTKIASKEGLVTAVHDTMVKIFGEVMYEIAIEEVVSEAAGAAFIDSLPIVGAVISAVHLPSRYEKIANKLALKACMLHELWIMQNITGLLASQQLPPPKSI